MRESMEGVFEANMRKIRLISSDSEQDKVDIINPL
jgi:hypothetical protein